MTGACDSHQADPGPAGRRCRRSWTHFSVWICLKVKYFDKPWQVYHYFSYTMFFWSRHFTGFLLNGLSCSKDCHGFWETESGGYLVKWQESGWWCEVEQISLWGYNGGKYIYIFMPINNVIVGFGTMIHVSDLDESKSLADSDKEKICRPLVRVCGLTNWQLCTHMYNMHIIYIQTYIYYVYFTIVCVYIYMHACMHMNESTMK